MASARRRVVCSLSSVLIEPTAGTPATLGTLPAVGELVLIDGRTLAWDEWGDPDGVPVLLFHGTPGCRLLPPHADQEAKDAGVRLVVPDRPGCGRSTFQPGRRLLDWPADVVALADHLALERFSVVGVSGGGPYALVTALAMPERLHRVASLCGVGPLDSDEARAAQPGSNRPIFDLAAAGPTAAAPMIEVMLAAAQDPDSFATMFVSMMPPEDQAVVDRLPELVPFMAEMFAEAGRQGAEATAYELWLSTQPWGFDVADIAVPIKFFHGDRDMNVPLAHPEALSAAIEGSTLTVWPGEAHMAAYSRMPDVLAAVTD